MKNLFAKTWKLWISLLFIALIIGFSVYFIFSIWMGKYTRHNEEIAIPELEGKNIFESLKLLDELKLTYEVDSVSYDPDIASNTIIDTYPKTGFKVKEGRKVFIRSNPYTWRPVKMPDLVGKSKRLAFAQLEIAGLKVGSITYEPDLAKDAVLKVKYNGESVAPETVLPRFSKIDLVLGKGLEYGTNVPTLVNMYLDDAKASIQENMFAVGIINYEGEVTDSANLRVFYQYPTSKDNYDQGLPIDLWVSETNIFEENEENKDKQKIIKNKIKELDKQFKDIFEEAPTENLNDIPEQINFNQAPQTAPSTTAPRNVEPRQPEGISIE